MHTQTANNHFDHQLLDNINQESPVNSKDIFQDNLENTLSGKPPLPSNNSRKVIFYFYWLT